MPAFLVGALVAAVCAATLCDGLASWVALFGCGLAGALFVVRSLPRPQIFFTAVYAAMFVLSFGRQWRESPASTLQFGYVVVVAVVAVVVMWLLLARLLGRGQRISRKTRVRPEYRLSPNGLNWGAGDFERVGWGAMTSVEPVAAGDRSLDIVTGAYRVVIRGERDGLLDLTETFYGPAATLFLLQHYIAHAEDRAELAGVWRFESRARRAAHARLTYPQAQPQLTQPSAAQQPG